MLNAPLYLHAISIVVFIVLSILFYIFVYSKSFQDVRDNINYVKTQFWMKFYVSNDGTITNNEFTTQIRELLSPF